ncbi:MAG: hypothetical protein LBL94_02620 [Prevotellaceae bacterium]|jgi:hypothetical protein|nr:hypothetical protein [Prevotellaceae bacterium]
MIPKLLIPTLVAVLLMPAAPLLAQPDSTKEESYVPKIEGLIKVKFEKSFYNGLSRFDVRNSRFSVRGNVSKNTGYRTQVEFNNEGKLSVLDAYVSYRFSIASISLGQQEYAFSNDLARSPMQNVFANRSFIAKYIGSYADTAGNVHLLSARDIGGLLTVNLGRWIPIVLNVGLFNGSGLNNPAWQENFNLSAKIQYGGEQGLQAAVSSYSGQTPYAQRLAMLGGELRYIAPLFTVDGEVAQRTYEQNGKHTLTAAFLQGLYKFYLKPNTLAHYLAPTARYDVICNGMHDSAAGQFDTQRLSVGLNIGVSRKPFTGEFRLNFEKYIASRKPDNFHTDELLHDKFTLEMVVRF